MIQTNAMSPTLIPPQLQNSSFVKLKHQTKSPFERDWSNKPYSYDKITKWIKGGRNYGVLGGYGDLCIVDADHPKSAEHFLAHFPKTFTVKTPGRGFHFYFICPEFSKSKTILDKDDDHYGEILGKGFQAVGPGSIHPEKKKPYEIFADEPIAEISADLLAEIIAPFIPIKPLPQDSYDSNIMTVLNVAGIKLSGDSRQLQGPHPIHGSTNGKNFSVSLEKNCWHCFRCGVGGGPIHLIAMLEELITCDELKAKGLKGGAYQQAKQLAISKYGLNIKNESLFGAKTITEKEVDEIDQKIMAIPNSTPKTSLPVKLDPILRELASINLAQVDAILRGIVKEHFGFTNEELRKYEKIIAAYRKENGRSLDFRFRLTPEQVEEALEEDESFVAIHPAQDFKDGKMYFGVEIKGLLFLINSERKLIDCSDENLGIKLKNQAVDTMRFSLKGVREYKSGSRRVSPAKVFQTVKDYIQTYVVLPDQMELNLMALWVMGTYVFQIFRYYPYIWLNAEKGSGKTHLMEILAPIVFNGDMAASVTAPVLYRDIENNLCTMLIDEVEKLRKTDRDVYGAVITILNAGFHREAAAKRVEKAPSGEQLIKKFRAYSPKILGGINEIDDVLKDRVIRMGILRKRSDEIVKRYKHSDELDVLHRDIRDDLYIFALDYAKMIADAYQNSDDSLTGITHLQNRELDIWEPMLVLAQLVDSDGARSKDKTDLFQQMVELSEKVHEDKRSDNAAENETVQLLEHIKSLLADVCPDAKEGQIVYYKNETALEYLKERCDFLAFNARTNTLTMKLRKIKIESKQKRIGEDKPQCYAIDMDQFNDMCKRLEVDPPESFRHSDKVV